jgi:hypothetical protein
MGPQVGAGGKKALLQGPGRRISLCRPTGNGKPHPSLQVSGGQTGVLRQD